MILYRVEWPECTWRGDPTGVVNHKYFETAMGAISSAGHHGGTITQLEISDPEWKPFVHERYVVTWNWSHMQEQSTFPNLEAAKAYVASYLTDKPKVRIRRVVTETVV